MPAKKKKKTVDEPKGAVAIAVFVGAVQTFLKVVFRPSVHGFFLWSTIFFSAAAMALLLGRGLVREFLCAVEPQTENGGMGCAKCADELLMCGKSQCYRSAMNITYQNEAREPSATLHSAFMEASTDITCSLMLVDAPDAVDMITQIYEGPSRTPPRTATQGCKVFHCGVLENAVKDISDLASRMSVCGNTHGTKKGSDETACICQSLLTTRITSAIATQIQNVCGSFITQMCADTSGQVYPSWCGTTTSTTTTNGTGASSRRLVEDTVTTTSLGRVQLPPVQEPPRSHCGGDGESDSGNVTGARGATGGDAEGTWGVNASERQLQSSGTANTATTATDTNDDLQDWTVGEWSKCKCYQQCVPGVKTRPVTCLASRCKEPEPPSKEKCDRCSHCAYCSVDLGFLVLMIFFFTEAGISFLVFICYVSTESVDEVSLIKISIPKKLVGMCCKMLPPIVRFLVIATSFQVVLIMVQTWVPKIISVTWSRDCFASEDLRVVAGVIAGLWVFQVVLGQLARRYTRRPPWLYVPSRDRWPAPLKQIFRFVRSIGP